VTSSQWDGRRTLFASSAELAERLDRLEEKYDGQFRVVFEAIRQLMVPVERKRGKIGFDVEGG